MSVVPRIERAQPEGPVTRAVEPIPVTVIIRWHTGPATEVPALAMGWTRAEVEVTWTDPWGNERCDWLRATDVRRRGEPARVREPDGDRAPRSQRRRRRW